MGWIKRNLFFVGGGLLALGLLGGAGFFIYTGWTRNADATTRLNEIYGKLQEIEKSPLQPGNKKINNTQIAKDQEKQLRDWIAAAGKSFHKIPALPPGANFSMSEYSDALRTTIPLLQHEAESASVTLPPNCYFSFSAQHDTVRFAPGSLNPLAAQLGEVKTIAEILFAARVNNLDGIQRVRVSVDDALGLQSDYIGNEPVTNDLAIITPYVVTFRSFTPELARVISGFAASPYFFIVKSISVQPAGPANEEAVPAAANAYVPYRGAGGPGDPYDRRRMMPGDVARGLAPVPAADPQTQPVPGKGGSQAVLKEQLLRITLEVEIVKLLPK